MYIARSGSQFIIRISRIPNYARLQAHLLVQLIVRAKIGLTWMKTRNQRRTYQLALIAGAMGVPGS